jgi:DNA polymerase III subunit delta'
VAGRGRLQAGKPTPAPLAEMGWPDWVDPRATQTLRDALRDGKIGHAYLLSGPKGVGKASLARAFAQSLCCTNCDEGNRSRPCSACRACRNVARGAHPDVERFDLEAQANFADKATSQASLSIDTVRRLRSSAALFPLEAANRVVIIDDAETMLEPAQQALLKTLEEPPPAVTILLLSDDAEALLDTVRSRCQEVRVRPVPEAAVERTLLDRGVDEREAAAIAELSRGAPAWAIAAASDAQISQSRKAERDAALTWLMAGTYDRLVTAFKLGDQFGKRRGEVIGIVLATVQVLRDRMIRAAGRNDGGPAMGASALALSRAVAASLRCLADLEANVRPRLALEAMVVQWPILDQPPD